MRPTLNRLSSLSLALLIALLLITSEEAAAHYEANALGFGANAMLPGRKANVGVRYSHEFYYRSTYRGYTLQIFGAITF